MLISPKQFAEFLKRSTLNPSEQHALLKLLPSLSADEIQRIAQILKKDVDAQHKVLADINRKRDALLLKFHVEFGKLKEET